VPALSISGGVDGGRQFTFSDMIVVGRGGTADLVLADSSVSRRHAQITWEGSSWTVRDLASANGTFVNERRVSADTPLSSGDTLRVGSLLLTFSDDPDQAPAPDTSSIRLSADEVRPHVVLRVDATETAEAAARPAGDNTGAWSLIAESLGRISSMMFDERALLAFVVEELLKILPRAERAFVLLWDPEMNRFVPSASQTRTGKTDAIVASRTILDEVLARREAVLITDAGGDSQYARADSIVAMNMRSGICAPILFQQDIFGVIQVDSTSGPLAFGPRDMALTLALVSQVAMALAYARVHLKLIERELVDRDLNFARKIQHHFLQDTVPTLAGFTFGVEYKPAQAVGGDLYDFVALGDGRLAVAVGDVSGKGVAAALFAAKVMSDIRYQAAGVNDPAALLRGLNQTLAARDCEGMFVTLAIAVIDSRTRRLTVAGAGHPLPIVRDSAGQVTTIGKTGDAPLGVDAGSRFAQHEYEFEPGDAVLMYTDGVVEALSGTNELFGHERLCDTIAGGSADPARLVREVAESVDVFAGEQPQSDDLTVVCFQRVAP
jgi:serine phosphatase RsbU (regulator of sigma subunit)/pSer/pThr/pTyr-binding forkhead associated (FHA) protein